MAKSGNYVSICYIGVSVIVDVCPFNTNSNILSSLYLYCITQEKYIKVCIPILILCSTTIA